ncbi:MAG TPA: RIP metalloprotease RseP [Pyrinomonadaceae bacterium]|nr:RIP metalloprotease RseP [Pyrinomonadaceae bacterium]
MNLTGIFAFIFILGAAVVLHEFGHFIVAKLLRIRVETFSVGFGKRIWGRRWGQTDYRLSLIPLGGYVKLGGDDSNAGLEEGAGEEIPPKERFDLRPRWQKFLVGVAGPVMNILTALAIPFAAALIQGIPASASPVVGFVEPNGAAAVAGLRPGDRIVSFNGRENPSWRFINGEAGVNYSAEMPLVVDRGGQRVQLTLKPTVREQMIGGKYGELDLQPDLGVEAVTVDRVVEGSPAAEAGLKAGDQIVMIGDEAARSTEQVKQYIRKHPEGRLRLVVNRDGGRVELQTPERRSDNKTLGFYFAAPPLEPVGVGAAAAHAVELNVEVLRLTGVALGQVFSGHRGIGETLSGPIEIAQVSSEAANNFGWEGVFNILAFLSLNLGIFNLLPIPVLDGGMIFMLLVEGLLALVGVKLSMTVRERIQQVGFVFLLLLMGFVIINDVTKVASRWRNSASPPAATETK